MHPALLRAATTLVGLSWMASAIAANVGWRQIQLVDASPGAPAMSVALYYPTTAPERPLVMGPFALHAAVSAPAAASMKGLILLSHGTGGSELGHSSLAQALARHGYLVAAVRHPGDNWQDRSLLQQGVSAYFSQRPQHLSRVLDALLQDPAWGPRIAADADGPRVGALGHSAGGTSVLALAGGEPDPQRLLAHCSKHRVDDPIFCSLGRSTAAASAPAITTDTAGRDAQWPMPPLTDRRVRAVVALAPVGVIFSARSLQGIRIPVAIYGAQRDRFLVPRFHAQWIAYNMPTAEVHEVRDAWHFAFMDTPVMPIPTEDGDLAADPPGFDRARFLAGLTRELPAFFDKALRVDQ